MFSQFDKKKHLTRSNWFLKFYLILVCTPVNITIKTGISIKAALSVNVRKHIKDCLKHKGEEFEILYLGAKTLNCTLCEFSSGLKKDLRKHITDVHGGKQQYFCEICNSIWKKKKIVSSK